MENRVKKYRWLAMLLTLSVGAGHIYIGNIKKGFFFFVVPLLLIFLGSELEYYISGAFIVLSLLSLFLFIYAFVDIWKSFPLGSNHKLFFSHWYYVVLFIGFSIVMSYPTGYLAMNYSPTRTFSIPASSMESTVYKGDYIIGFRTKEFKRGDVVIFRYPLNPNIFYIKRVVAMNGDEVVYQDKRLFIHFSEGDEWIKENYKANKIFNFREKLWVENPYIFEHRGINYTPKNESVFKYLVSRRNDMQAVYIEELGEPLYVSESKEKMNAFYKKVDTNAYYMMGDNRDNSSDSRFWGVVNDEHIWGIPKYVYFNLNDFSRIGKDIK